MTVHFHVLDEPQSIDRYRIFDVQIQVDAEGGVYLCDWQTTVHQTQYLVPSAVVAVRDCAVWRGM